MTEVERQMAERILVWHAQGVVMADHHCSASTGLTIMRSRSFAEGCSMVEVAAAVIRERERLDVRRALQAHERERLASRRAG